MNNIEKNPCIVYDNLCYLCTKFAKIVHFFAGGKIAVVGHHTDLGQKIREKILDDSALKMFWFIDKKYAFGGRAALFPLLKVIMTQNKLERISVKIEDNCMYDCKTVKAVFIRSASLLLNSKKIKIN